MPAERNVFDRKIFKLGALAAGPLILVACAAEKQQSAPTIPPQYVDNPINQSGQEPSTQQISEPTTQSIKTKTPQKTATRVPTATTPSKNPTPQTNKDSQNPVNLEPYVDEFGSLINTVIRGNYKYTYKLIQNADPKIGIPNIQGFYSDPKLDAYIPNTEKRNRITNLYQQALDKNIANPNDPEIPQLILDASMVLKDVCTNGFHKTMMEYNASMIYFNDPKFWQNNQFAVIDSNCFWGEKTAQ